MVWVIVVEKPLTLIGLVVWVEKWKRLMRWELIMSRLAPVSIRAVIEWEAN